MQIEINSITGTSPYQIYVCDYFGNNCVFVTGVTTTVPPVISFESPSAFTYAPVVTIKIIDSDGCETSELFYCVSPTQTPTITPTSTLTRTPPKTPTPTRTPLPTDSPTPSPTITPSSTDACICYGGSIESPDGKSCYLIYSANPISINNLTVGDAAYDANYGKNGVRIYKVNGFNLSGISTSGYYYEGPTILVDSQVTTQNEYFWSNRMNQIAVWVEGLPAWPGPGNYPNYVSLCETIYVDVKKVYFFGIGASDDVSLYINGVLVLDQPGSGPPPIFPTVYQNNFEWWNIYPFILNSGPNIIEVRGWNRTSFGALAVEIYENTVSQLSSTINGDGLNIIFSTADYRTGGPKHLEFFCSDFFCPSGYTWDVNDYKCKLIDYLDCFEVPSPTPTETPTRTPTPTLTPTKTTTPTKTATVTPTKTVTPTITPTKTPTQTPTPTVTPTITLTPTNWADCGLSGYSYNLCYCPSGFTEVGNICQSASTVLSGMSGSSVLMVAGDQNYAYQSLGTYFYEEITNFTRPLTFFNNSSFIPPFNVSIPPLTPANLVDGTNFTPSSCSSFYNYNDVNTSGTVINREAWVVNVPGIWFQSGSSSPITSIMNTSGVKVSTALNQWVGFSVCINLPSTDLYHLFLAGDDVFRLRMDGEWLILRRNNSTTYSVYEDGVYDYSLGSGQPIMFKWGHVLPITLDAGQHVFEFFFSDVNSVATNGVFEIYSGATNAILSGYTNYSQIVPHLVFSSSQVVGTFQTVIGDPGDNYGIYCLNSTLVGFCDTPYCLTTTNLIC